MRHIIRVNPGCRPWYEGTIDGYLFQAKVYEKVEKFTLYTRRGKTLASYDRGWDVKPLNTDVKNAALALVRRLNKELISKY